MSWYPSPTLAFPNSLVLLPWVPPDASYVNSPPNAQNEPIVLLPIIQFDDQSDQAGLRVKRYALSPPGLSLAPPQLLQRANGTEGSEERF